MEDRTDALNHLRKPRMTRCEEIDDEPLDESHAGRLRELLLERESATERFRAFKRRLLEER